MVGATSSDNLERSACSGSSASRGVRSCFRWCCCCSSSSGSSSSCGAGHTSGPGSGTCAEDEASLLCGADDDVPTSGTARADPELPFSGAVRACAGVVLLGPARGRPVVHPVTAPPRAGVEWPALRGTPPHVLVGSTPLLVGRLPPFSVPCGGGYISASQYACAVGYFFWVVDTSRIKASETITTQSILRFSHSATKRLPRDFRI
jgi:hypothetical protein